MTHPYITPEFETYAKRLGDVKFSPSARPFYELMSGALMWEDEKPDIPFSEIGWFRAALAYRTSLIFGHADSSHEPIWTALRRLAPDWPGFRPERCTPSPELVACFHGQAASMDRSFDRLEAALTGRWKPLSGRGREGSSGKSREASTAKGRKGSSAKGRKGSAGKARPSRG